MLAFASLVSSRFAEARVLKDVSCAQISLNRFNLKKPLRVKWEGEEGIDAGGLRKEWFLLLCRQLFDPQVRPSSLPPRSPLPSSSSR